ncbi:MAG: peptide ABC transporter substrate-binding protein [Kiritimatiellales bacterium]|nr:peptide ABC transporter substrate-binding protein [Kiritimatiellales bacterium]
MNRFTFLAILLLLSGCAKRETPVETGNREKILHLGNLSEPKDLDPHVVTSVSAGNVISALLEGLVAEAPNDPSLKPVPGVAESWTVSDDRTVYTFRLRANAKWSNGDPVTADDFVFSYHRILSPAMGSPYAYMLHLLKNGRAYNLGTIPDFEQVGVKAIDSKTLELTLENPTASFLSQLKHWSWFPVHPPTILKYGRMDEIGTAWTQPGNFIGNGPFILKAWRQNQSIVVQKNPLYWDADTVSLNEIRFYPIGDHKIEERSFRAGQLHVTGTVPLDRVQYYRENKPELLRLDPYLRSYYYLLNVKKAPFNDVRVRKALAMAIDRKKIANFVTRSGEQPAYSFTPPFIGSYKPPMLFSTDVEAARKLLAEAGYPNGENFPATTLLYNTSDLHTRIAEVVQQMWKDNLGIDIELENVEWKVYQERRKNRLYDIARAEWVADFADPSSFLDVWLTDGGNNHAGWSSARYDDLLKQAASTDDSSEQNALYAQAETILIGEQPIIPLLFLPSKSLIQPSVKGWNPSILDHHPYKYIRLEE